MVSLETCRYLSMLLHKGLYEEAFAVAADYIGRGEYGQALITYQLMLEKLPDTPTLRYNYAMALEKLGRYSEAQEQYQKLFAELPEYGRAAIGYARMLEQGRRYADAVTVLRAATLQAQDDPTVAVALGNSLVMAGEAEAALLWYAVSRAWLSESRATKNNFLYTLLMVAEISPRTVAYELQQVAGFPALALRLAEAARLFRQLNSDVITGFHRNFGTTCMQEITTRWLPDQQSGSRRTRIGYLSADLYAHPVGYFLEGVLPNHDPQRWEVFVFSPYAERDQLTASLVEAAEHLLLLDDMDRDDMLKKVRSCGLDIAVDMAGHTGGNYLDLFAKGLATTQITWGGYPSTTGLVAMDYIVADHIGLPPKDESCYTERPLYLPNGYICFSPPADAPLVASLPALTSGQITFGSFNTVQKLNGGTLALWGAVLRALPESRLFLKAKGFDDPLVCCAFLEKLAAEGVMPDRIMLEGYSPRSELLAAYQRVDIALDPIPYQGGVTILEALWMGVPTLVIQGSRPPFIRHGESHLVNVGLPDWIAVSEDDYIARAVHWNRHLLQLSAIRHRLRQQMAASPLCDTVGFTRDLEAAYEKVWREQRTFGGR